MANKFQQANLFELSDDCVQVNYSSSSFAGPPLFSYRDEKINRQFSGTEIQSVQTSIGELLTVTLEQIPDLRTVTFTLILPVVNLTQGSTAQIEAPGITTTTHTTIAGPPPGPAMTYSQVALKGTAQAVEF